MIFEKLAALIAEQFNVDADSITMDTSFTDDLNADSVDIVDLSMALEEEFGVLTRCGLHCAPQAHNKMGTSEGGTVRVSPSVFTRRQELDVLVQNVAAIARGQHR